MSPIKSKAQGRKFAEMLNDKKITKKVFKEWTSGVNTAKLPERLTPKKVKSTDELRKLGKRFGVK